MRASFYFESRITRNKRNARQENQGNGTKQQELRSTWLNRSRRRRDGAGYSSTNQLPTPWHAFFKKFSHKI
ncbi:hypothetical protein PCASD_05663 [Puccinia coronata f. sp. avenae]|uniref:Uncharacterized protein n=1 Tax=Puccinia coronata f. sp. avenae TaxID=200324 RepID=A0A2N5UVF3_9BASI|nr:hypothetical protein PCASD_05663 [Puccinia coronata f. sp. avenae]